MDDKSPPPKKKNRRKSYTCVPTAKSIPAKVLTYQDGQAAVKPVDDNVDSSEEIRISFPSEAYTKENVPPSSHEIPSEATNFFTNATPENEGKMFFLFFFFSGLFSGCSTIKVEVFSK